MTPERWERVSEVFEGALGCEPEARKAYLARACAEDAELEAEVAALLEEHERAGGFLDTPVSTEAASALRDVSTRMPLPTEHDPYLDMTLGGRYSIEARLGRGGQGSVYRARDLTLMSKTVVVKVMPDDGGEKPWLRKSFAQEMEALSRIDHPGVVGVLDTGILPNGAPFLVMQHVDGVTLRQALESGPLDRKRTASIVRQIGAALEAVHSIEIAHRDLKPENIILQRLRDGSELVKLIDFGIAKLGKPAASSDSTGAMLAGTARYMAPEQFKQEGSRASDIYAFGLIICEMLSGVPEVESLHERRRVLTLIRRALADRPEDRFGSAREFCEQVSDALLRPRMRLRNGAAAIVGTTLILLAIPAWVLMKPGVPPAGIHTLAILPFEMLGPSAEKESFEVGIADSVITRLDRVSGLIIRPISLVRRYDLARDDALTAARNLRVDAVVEGTLQMSADGIRANVRLIRAQDGKPLWAGTVDSKGNRLFSVEDSIAQEIALRINARLTESERRSLESRRNLNPEAHALYVRGRYEWGRRNLAGFERAADYFRQAIDIDPTYASAYVGLADCYLMLGGYSHYPFLEMLPKAKSLASRALELEPSLGQAHATLALVSQNLDWDWKMVERDYLQAISLAPNYATGHHWYAEFLSILGRFEESRREFAQARTIDPISPIIQVDEAQLYFFQREYGRSLEILQGVEKLDPTFELAYDRIATIYMIQGREDEAWSQIQRIADCSPETSDCSRIWTAYLPKRGAAAARQALQWMEAEATQRHIPPSALVFAHARQGEYDRALDWLEYMLDNHEVLLITAKVNPIFDPLRAHPRFKKVLEKLDLAQ